MDRYDKKEYSKWQSRKWGMALLVVILATLGTFLPPPLSAWVFGATKPLIVLSGAEWVSVITLVTALYIGGNIYQKHIEHKSLTAGFSISASVSSEIGNEENAASSGAEDGDSETKEA